MKVAVGIVAVIALAALIFGMLAFFQEDTKQVVKAELQSEETLVQLRENLLDEGTITHITSAVLTEENIATAFEDEAYNKVFHDTPLRPFDRSAITNFVRIAVLQPTVVPLEPDEDGKIEPFPLRQMQIFAWMISGNRVVIVDKVGMEDFPETLTDGRPYDITLDIVLFPDSGVENPQFQEPLGGMVYPTVNTSEENMVPVLVFERNQPVLARPGGQQKIASANTLKEGMKLYQVFSITGAVKTTEFSVVQLLPEGLILVEGNFDSPVEGGFLFNLEGLPIAVVVDRAGAHMGVAMPLEHVLDALVQEGVISGYEKVGE